MAFSTGYAAAWSDVQSLYTRLNTARQKFSMSTVSVPGNPGTMSPTQVTALKNAVEAMSSNQYVSSTANTGITVPAVGTLIYPDIFNSMSNTITNIQNKCVHNAAFYTSNHGFGSFSNHGFSSFGNHGFDSNGNFTFHSSSGTANSFTS